MTIDTVTRYGYERTETGIRCTSCGATFGGRPTDPTPADGSVMRGHACRCPVNPREYDVPAGSHYPPTPTPNGAVIWTALAGEEGRWLRSHTHGWRFFLEPSVPYDGALLQDNGRLFVHGRLGEKVAHLDGQPYTHGGYVGWVWKGQQP